MCIVKMTKNVQNDVGFAATFSLTGPQAVWPDGVTIEK